MAENKKIEFSIVDLLKFFFDKKILIITVTLVGLVLGCVFGAVTVPSEEHTIQLQFAVTSMRLDNNALYRFRSETFIEQLLLDSNGLPAPADKDNPSEDYIKAAEAREAYMGKLKRYKEVEKDIFALSIELNDAKLAYEAALEEHKNAIDIYTAYLEITTPDSNKLKEYEDEVIAKKTAYDSAKSTYVALQHRDNELQAEKSSLDYDAAELQKIKNETANVLLKEWRADETTRSNINTLMSSVSIAYPSDTSKTDGNKMLVVTISIQDKELAEQVAARAVEYIPEFVGDYDGILSDDECILLNTNTEFEQKDGNPLVKNIAKFGLVAGGACLVVVCGILSVIYLAGVLFPKEKKSDEEAEEKSEE